MIFGEITRGIEFTGDLKRDIEALFTVHDALSTYEHILNVVNEAVQKFVADKLSWESPVHDVFQVQMRARIHESDLNGAVLVYLDHVWEQRQQLKLVHPWLIEARAELRGNKLNRG
ncbi:hypothetical protein JCM10914_3114 [Paenibacillus sp. JCM 10914]|nr:hypothetical protein JCM10914_3114 [Paenibacillus sp. JCM 10914]